jgi:hypothetical protein
MQSLCHKIFRSPYFHKLNWKEHINVVTSKISKSIAIIYKASRVLNTDSLYMLYCTLFLPYISYCAEVWGNTYKTNLRKIFLKQKHVIRIICKAKRRDHSTPLFKKMNVFKLYDLIEQKSAIFMYKAHKYVLPNNLQILFICNEDNHNTRQRNKFKQKYVRTKQKQMCMSVYGAKLWNSISKEIKNSKTLYSFKTTFKYYLLSKYE